MLVSQLGERRYGASLHVTQRTVVYIEQSFKLLIYNLLLLTIIKSILCNVFSDECCFFSFITGREINQLHMTSFSNTNLESTGN